MEVYHKVLVEPLLKLEGGNISAYFAPTRKMELLCGSLLCIIADDIAQRGAQVCI
jgi:hypothetical protein